MGKKSKEKSGRKLKPLAIFSGIGGLLIGGAVVVVKKRKKDKTVPAPVKLPEEAQWIILKSGEFEIASNDQKIKVRTEYTLQPTHFKVWRLLEGENQGLVVYYITPRQFLNNPDGSKKEVKGEAFYGLVAIPGKKRDLLSHVQKGNRVVFHICLVGGSPNGIPTGEKIISRGTLEEWEFITKDSI